MEYTKFNGDKNAIIAKKVLVTETLRNIPHGTEIHFTRKELGGAGESTVNSAASRLNSDAPAKEFTVEVDSNDGSYIISRA